MKKLFLGLTMLLIWAVTAPVLANLDDTRETIAQRYGEYRLVIDKDNQPWTKEQWEKSGYKKARPDTYTYRFRREDLGIGLDVKFEGDKPGSFVQMQRFTPDMPFQIKDFQKLFPEIYPLLASPHSIAFSASQALSLNFMEQSSPVTLGVAMKKDLGGERKGYFSLLAFNIQDEGRLIKDAKFIDENTYVREFTIEKTYLSVLKDNMPGEWQEIKNYFVAEGKQNGPATKLSPGKTGK